MVGIVIVMRLYRGYLCDTLYNLILITCLLRFFGYLENEASYSLPYRQLTPLDPCLVSSRIIKVQYASSKQNLTEHLDLGVHYK